jgi:elongation factor G
MVKEDPSFYVETDQESGETILKGMGELHLDIKVDILRRTYGVDAAVGAPQVAYRETLARATDIDYTHKKQTGGTGQFARVKLKLEPNETGKGNAFETSIIGGTVPKEYIPGVEKGVKSVWENGMLIGFPMVDMKVNLYDGAYHEVDSSAIAFEIATRAAMKEGCEKAGVKILEPIMDVEVVTPGEFVGGIIGDLNSRRGQVRDQQMRGNATVIRAFVPLANMFGYINTLRSMSTGRAQYTMQFAHYSDVPKNVADEVKAKYA